MNNIRQANGPPPLNTVEQALPTLTLQSKRLGRIQWEIVKPPPPAADTLQHSHLSTPPTGVSLSAGEGTPDDLRAAERKLLMKQAGYTGSICPGCGSDRMRQNGTCEKCEACGGTTGCG
jgi:hypothetical protein